MKKPESTKLTQSIKSLALIFSVLFFMAFACGDETTRDSEEKSADSTSRTKTKGGGKCSTEQEFKNLLIESFSATYNERDGKFKDTEVEFQSFEIGRPFRYQMSYPEVIDAENAYPVTTSFITRDHLNEKSFPRVFEVRAEDNKYTFYIDHRGECVFAKGPGGTRETESISLDR